jgi:hypothetical protein
MTDKSDYRAADDRYEAQNDDATEVTGDVKDNSYVRPGETTIPVQKDTAPVEDPMRPPESDSDAQVGMLPSTYLFVVSVCPNISANGTSREGREGGYR